MTPLSKDFVAIIIGVIALVIAAGAFYEISTLDKQVLTKSGQIDNPDYTSQINSLDSKVDSLANQVNSLNSQVGSISDTQSTLKTLKSNVSDIQAKLNTLENKVTQSESPGSTPTPLSILLDKSSYLQSDIVKIIAVGANPQKPIQIQLLDNTGYIVMHKDTLSDSAGRVSLDLPLSNSLTPGNYLVQIVSDQQTKSQSIAISSSNPSTPSPGSFTAQTDKTIYNVGNLIQVTGTGNPNTSITGVLTSPTGRISTTTTTTHPDGTYTLYLFTSQPYETGAFSISVTSLGQTKSLSVYIQSGGSSGTTALTAQIDKSTYKKGDWIILKGVGQSNTSVSGVLTSPTLKSTTINAPTDDTGAYTLVFSISPSSDTGTWSIVVTNLSQTKSLTLSLTP